ncbi:uncharacterized protein HMPREF1541_10916 [Cyphellophora europaea CBS 101466]|uniref:Uncharacterized protein n=1 Tax=Cyphellophora europaea (strain CBS 101466) TaxID=1220924 RepID=W2S5R0_CYPE1|nr:uncharacterized protein HMPREF1541_10916 [Cyphellophora europaea CBS 101466]ETN44051.1 hypothetical protein HMPREF1541_10916 [Cyphellophora europaea CBS 101466]
MAPAWLEKFITREDATPDPRRSSDQPIHEIRYTAVAEHRRILSVAGGGLPHYELKRESVLGSWGSKCYVTSPSNQNAEVAVLDFHALPRAFTEIKLLQRNHDIKISTSKQKFIASGGLGSVYWKGTGGELQGHASWELRDETSLVMSVMIDSNQTNGVISLFKEKLEAETIEELIMVGLAKIEDYKHMLRASKRSLIGAVINMA